MELIKPGLRIDFVGKMKLFMIVSIVAVVGSILLLIVRGGPILGVDFAGGTALQVKFNRAVTTEQIRSSLGKINQEDSTIQQIGPAEANEFLIRTDATAPDMKDITEKFEGAFTDEFGRAAFEIRRTEAVGAKAGKELRQKGIMALCFSFIGMLIYVAWRYEFRFALGGIVALIHDAIITIGAITLLGMEFTLTIIAAVLTLIGFSINDTVVIFDRIRENMRKDSRRPLRELVNESINQTLSRTVLTNLTVLLVLLALYFFGGEIINDFALTMLIGVIVGTYSTVFVASQLVLIWENFRPSVGRKKEK